jgi:hypothetical protein
VIGSGSQARATLTNTSGATVTFECRNWQLEYSNNWDDLPGAFVATTGAIASKYFTDLNGNTVDPVTYVVTEAVGAPLLEFPSLYAAPAMENLVLQSNNTPDGIWVKASGVNNFLDQAGLTGTPDTASRIVDNQAASTSSIRQDVTIPNDTNPTTAQVFIKKDSDVSRFPNITLYILSGGTLQDLQVHLNTSTGATAVVNSTGTVAHEVDSVGDWWVLYLQVANNGTGNINSRVNIAPAASTTFGGADEVATTGEIILGNAGIYNNKTIAQVKGAAPIVTAGTSVTNTGVLISYAAGNHSLTNGAYYAESVGSNFQLGAATNKKLLALESAQYIWNLSGNGLGAIYFRSPGSTSAYTTSFVDGENKVGASYGGTTQAVNHNGVWSTETTFSDFTSPNDLVLLRANNYISPPEYVGFIRNLQRWDLDYTAGRAKIDELMGS